MAKSSGPTAKEPSLPDSELDVLRILWEKGHATAREVWSTLAENGSRWTYATVNTLLQRLESKGLAESDKSRMTYIYSPKISRQEVLQRRVGQLVDKLCDGKGGALVLHLLQSHPISKEEAADVHQLLDAVLDRHDKR